MIFNGIELKVGTKIKFKEDTSTCRSQININRGAGCVDTITTVTDDSFCINRFPTWAFFSDSIDRIIIESKEELKNSYIYNFPDDVIAYSFMKCVGIIISDKKSINYFKSKAVYCNKDGEFTYFDAVPDNTKKSKIDFQKAIFRFFQYTPGKISNTMQTKIKITDTKFPVIIYDLDEEKKNKVMRALGVTWDDKRKAEQITLSRPDNYAIACINKFITWQGSCESLQSDYPLTHTISYNDIIWKDEFGADLLEKEKSIEAVRFFGINIHKATKKIHYTEIKKPFVITDLNKNNERCKTANEKLKLGFTQEAPFTQAIEYTFGDCGRGWMDKPDWYKTQHEFTDHNFYSYDDIDWEEQNVHKDYYASSVSDCIQYVNRFKRCKNLSEFIIPEEEVLDFKVNHNRKSFTLPEEE